MAKKRHSQKKQISPCFNFDVDGKVEQENHKPDDQETQADETFQEELNQGQPEQKNENFEVESKPDISDQAPEAQHQPSEISPEKEQEGVDMLQQLLNQVMSQEEPQTKSQKSQKSQKTEENKQSQEKVDINQDAHFPSSCSTKAPHSIELDSFSTSADSPIQTSLTIHLLHLRTSLNHLQNIHCHIPVAAKLTEALQTLAASLDKAIEIRKERSFDNYQMNSNQVYRLIKQIKYWIKDTQASEKYEDPQLVNRVVNVIAMSIVSQAYYIQSNIQGKEKDREARIKTKNYFLKDFYELRLYMYLLGPYLQTMVEKREEKYQSCALSQALQVLMQHSAIMNHSLEDLIKILLDMEIPTVEEVKESRLGKSLNKLVKNGGNQKIIELAQKVMSKWKKAFEGPQNTSLGKRVKKAEPIQEEVKKLKKRVKFQQAKAENPGEWLAEKRLENYCYYLISDDKFKMYRDIEDNSFQSQIYTLKQLSSLFPKLFCFQNVSQFRNSANLLDRVENQNKINLLSQNYKQIMVSEDQDGMKPIIQFCHSKLLLTKRYPRISFDLEQIEQNQRESMIFMVRYLKDILIPSTPLEKRTIDNPRPLHFRIDLEEIYQKIQKEKEEKIQLIQDFKELEETLSGTQGFYIYQQMTEKVFRQIRQIYQSGMLEIVMNEEKVKEYDQIHQKEMKKTGEIFSDTIVRSMIQIWNIFIQQAEFQFFEQETKLKMVVLNQEHSQKEPKYFAYELIKFYSQDINIFIDMEKNKQKFNLLMLNQQRNRNFRTLPCKAFHPQSVETFPGMIQLQQYQNLQMPKPVSKQAQNPGYCHRAEICNFIHSEAHKGGDIPREVFYQLRAQNQQRFQVFLYLLNPSLQQVNNVSKDVLLQAKSSSGFDNYCKALLHNVRMYEQNRQIISMGNVQQSNAASIMAQQRHQMQMQINSWNQQQSQFQMQQQT